MNRNHPDRTRQETTPARRAVTRAVARIAAISIALLLNANPTHADRVELTTGEVFFGDILRADDYEVSIRLTSGGVLSFRCDKVEYFRRNFVDRKNWHPDANVDSGKQTRDSHDNGPTMIVSEFVSPPDLTEVDTSEEPDTIVLQKTEPPVEEIKIPLNPKLVESIVRDSRRGYQIAPPKGFLSWPQDEKRPVAAFYQDPVTQANLNVLAYLSAESIDVIKKRAIRSYSEQVASFRVVRDESLNGVPYDGWLFEVKSRLMGQDVHQLQVFVSNRKKVFVLTFSTSETHFSGLRQVFEESVRSFAFIDEKTDNDVEPEDDPNLAVKGSDAPKSGKAQFEDEKLGQVVDVRDSESDIGVIVNPENTPRIDQNESSLIDLDRALRDLQEQEEAESNR